MWGRLLGRVVVATNPRRGRLRWCTRAVDVTPLSRVSDAGHDVGVIAALTDQDEEDSAYSNMPELQDSPQPAAVDHELSRDGSARVPAAGP